MKRVIITTLFLFTLIPQYDKLYAQEKNIGVGFILGNPFGFTGKFFLDSQNAFDFGIGDPPGDGYYIYGDYLKHFSDIFTVKELLSYIGIGPGFHHYEKEYRNKEDEEENRLEARMPFGLEYLTPKVPLGIFLELVPSLRFVPDIDFHLRGGLGARFYF